MTERDFQKAVCDTLRLFGWRYTHFRPAYTSKGYRTPLTGDKGFPDTAVRGNRLLYIELKAGKNILTDEQGRWLGALASAGQSVHVWHPDHWPEIEAALR